MVKKSSKNSSSGSGHYIAIVAIVAVVAVVILVMNSMQGSTTEEISMKGVIESVDDEPALAGEGYFDNFKKIKNIKLPKKVTLEKLVQPFNCQGMRYQCSPGYSCDPIYQRRFGQSFGNIVQTLQNGPLFRCIGNSIDYPCTGVNRYIGISVNERESGVVNYNTGEVSPNIPASQTISCAYNPGCPDGFNLIRGQNGDWQCNKVIETDCLIDERRVGSLTAVGLESVGNDFEYTCSLAS